MAVNTAPQESTFLRDDYVLRPPWLGPGCRPEGHEAPASQHFGTASSEIEACASSRMHSSAEVAPRRYANIARDPT